MAHVPYPGVAEKGTVRSVHGSKLGAVWVEYPGSTTLHEVAHDLLFPTPDATQEHREDARRGKKPKPKAQSRSDPQTNRLTDPKTYPLPDPQTNRLTEPRTEP